MSDAERYFRIEAKELLASLEEAVGALETDPKQTAPFGTILRAAHTLKGAARVVGQHEIARVARAIEERATAGSEETAAETWRPALRQALDELVDAVSALDAPATRKRGFAAALIGRPARAGPAAGSRGDDAEEAPSHPTSVLRGAPAEPRSSSERPASSEGSVAAAPSPRLDTVRVEMGELDALLEAVMEARAGLRTFHGLAAKVRAALRQLDAGALQPDRGGAAERAQQALRATLREVDAIAQRAVPRMATELDEAREMAWRIRMFRVEVIFSELERVARDAARELDKRVRFTATGGRQRLDAPVLAAVRDALGHVVRNAVVHGIEAPEERSRLGKAVEGQVTLAIESSGDRVVIRCRDDGRGIDVAAIQARARRLGWLDDTEDLAPQEAAALALRSGMTTCDRVTDLAGKGLGLDVVRDTVARLGGDLAIDSEPGQGCSVSLTVPATIVSLPMLELEAGGLGAGLPLAAVRRVQALNEGAVIRSATGDRLAHDGAAVPCADLAALLGRAAGGPRSTAVIVEAGGIVGAILVDRVLDMVDAVVKPVPPIAFVEPIVAGVGVGAGERPRLLLDPRRVVESLSRHPGTAPLDQPSSRLPLLVVDDSLTTRMLEKNILESAGYEVDVASSGEEALEKVLERRYGLLVVDVEMPGIRGFELIETLRRDPELRHLPAILVTSLARPEDRRRGMEAGAQAYIVKSDFDQTELVAIVDSLVLDVGEAS